VALWTAAVCLADTLTFALLEMTGWMIPPVYQPTPLGIWAALVQFVLICAVPVGQILESLREALDGLRRREHALQESEERFRSLANNAPVMITMTGPDQVNTFFNKSWLDFTGRTQNRNLAAAGSRVSIPTTGSASSTTYLPCMRPVVNVP
jgi:PAS domain-containing protein